MSTILPKLLFWLFQVENNIIRKITSLWVSNYNMYMLAETRVENEINKPVNFRLKLKYFLYSFEK